MILFHSYCNKTVHLMIRSCVELSNNEEGLE